MFLSFSQWVASFKRHWRAAGISFAIVGFLTVGVILFGTREYRSVSRLLMRIGHENGTLDPVTSAAGERISPVHTREDEIETAIGVMQSRSIMEAVVDKVGAVRILNSADLEKPTAGASDTGATKAPSLLSRLKSKIGSIDPISDRESAVRKLEAGFSIFAPDKSSLITVEYVAKSPAVAQELVKAWTDTYLQHHAKVNRTQGTYEFFLGQDDELRQQLQEVHEAIRNAKSKGGFVTLDGHQKILESQVQNVRNELMRAAAEWVEADARVVSYEDLLANAVEKLTTEEVSGIASEARNEMRGVLFQLEVLEKEYAAKYKEQHPKLLAIRDQLANASKIVDAQEAERRELRQTVNPTHQKIRENQVVDMALRDALAVKVKKLTTQQSELLDEIQQLNGEEEHLVGLLREAAVLEDRNKLHSVLLERARLNEVLEESRITSINVVQPASFEARPVSPNKRVCAMLGLFAAIVIAVSLPVLLDARLLMGVEAGKADSVGHLDTGGSGRQLSRPDRTTTPETDAADTQAAMIPEPEGHDAVTASNAACNGGPILANQPLSQTPTLPR